VFWLWYCLSMSCGYGIYDFWLPTLVSLNCSCLKLSYISPFRNNES
jgi:hypothetical protein